MGNSRIIANAKTVITNMLEDGANYREIAAVCGVSRQRISHLAAVYGLQHIRVRGYWAKQPIEHQWLWKILCVRIKERKARVVIFNDLKDRLPTHCPVLGYQLNYHFVGRKQGCDDSPSVDRVNSSRGYELGNLCVISWRANQVKNNGTRAEHEKIANYMRRHGVS